MALAVPIGVPDKIIPGDTLTFKLCLADYKAGDGWACTVYFVGNQRLELAGTADGDDFLFSSSATNTASLTAGRAGYQVRVSKAGEVKTVHGGYTRIKNSLSSLDSLPQTQIDPAEMVRRIETAIQEILATGFSSFSIGGQSATNFSLTELYQMREKYASLARQKRVLERGRKTGLFGAGIQVRMS